MALIGSTSTFYRSPCPGDVRYVQAVLFPVDQSREAREVDLRRKNDSDFELKQLVEYSLVMARFKKSNKPGSYKIGVE